jgi:sodium-dependent dicarboxylate transporter 2/3/5
MTASRSRLKSTLPKRATWSDPHPPSEGGPNATRGGAQTPTAGDPGAARRRSTRTTTSKRRLQRRVTPLDVLQYPLQATRRAVFDLRRFLIVLALTGAVLLVPPPPGLSEEGLRAIALFVFTGSILALEPAPLPISALLVPVAQVALGIDDVQGAFSAFAQPTVFLVLSSLFLAEALRKHGLTRRLAIYAIVTSGGAVPRLVLNVMLLTALLSMWVLNTATTAVLIPLAITVAQYVPQQEHAKRVVATLVLGIAFAASLGGMSTVVGSGENAIAAGYLAAAGSFGFLDWMIYAVPLVAGLLVMTWWLLLRLMKLPPLRLDLRMAKRELVRIGAITPTERRILVVLAWCVVLWVGGSAIENWLGLPDTLLSSTVVSIGAVAYLSFSDTIDWNDLKGVNWGVFLVIGAGFTLGDALAKSGANAWFASALAPVLTTLPTAVVISAVVAIAFTITQFINNVALGAILTPVLMGVAQASGVPAERLVLPAIITLGLAFTLPGGSARMTLVAVSGAVERSQMVRVGLLIALPAALAVALFFTLLGMVGLI